MTGKLRGSGEDKGASGTIPFTPMVLYFMVIPLMAGFEQAIWSRTRFKCANVRPEISKYMSPDTDVEY